MTTPQGTDAQPISQIEWLERDSLHSNDYNPNNVAPPELRLLKISILEDGWTQPLVVTEDGEVVDGFHRWTVAGDEEVAALTGGRVPCVVLRGLTPDHQRMSTIRHNRARGQHHVVRMADIVNDLAQGMGIGAEEIMHRLQMDEEEFTRLFERGNVRGRYGHEEWARSWRPVPKGDPRDVGSGAAVDERDPQDEHEEARA